MHDNQAWTGAGKAACRILAGLGEAEFGLLAERIMALKAELLQLAQSAGSGEVCRTCGGECCLHGKYHVTLLDLVLMERAAWPLPSPVFGAGACCPYGGACGCSFEPHFRPMTCIIFNCDLIEKRLDTGTRQKIAGLERELRDAVAAVDLLAGTRLSRPALLASADGPQADSPESAPMTEKAGIP